VNRHALPALLVDYGEVISEPQPEDTIAAMASLAGLEVTEFVARYWQYRPAYDAGSDARTYWSQVIDSRPLPEQTLEQLIRLDMDSWSHMNEETLELLDEAHRRGHSLSLLSNAPHELAVTLTGHPALYFFDHLIFSARIGAVKPDAAAFQAAVRLLSRRPQDILFIDDRPDNVQGAIDAGLRAVRFTSAAGLRAELPQ
jgi:putative hydrolase of the HAD superfamily